LGSKKRELSANQCLYVENGETCSYIAFSEKSGKNRKY